MAWYSIGLAHFLKTSFPSFKFYLWNILELRLEEERPVVVEGARFEVERRGPIVEFFLH